MNKEQLLKEKSKYFAMPRICELADIKYQSFKNWKYGRYSLSEEKIDKLIKTMSTIMNEKT